MIDNINNPKHYNMGKIEVIDFIEDQGLNYNLGNSLKYICRCNYKNGIEDIEKAIWYLQREKKRQEKENANKTINAR